MKFALLHLSGQHRGETQYFDRPRVSLGSTADNDLIFPSEGPHPSVPSHVELFQSGCEIHLRNQDPSVTTFVNHNPLFEATLKDQDLIQLGPEGPKLRLHIRPEEFAACKGSREILQDALDVARESPTNRLRAAGSFLGQLTYEVRRHSSRATQIVLATLVILFGGAIGGIAYYSYTTQQTHEQQMATLLKQLESTRLTQAALEERTVEERQRMTQALATREAEVDRLVTMLEEQQRQGRGASPEEVRTLTRRLQVLESERTGAEVLIKR